MIQTFKAMRNPQVTAQQMINENPQLQSVLKMSNNNPEQAFKTMCKQMNVNPDEIMNMLR